MDHSEIIVIGAGVVGLAIARSLALRGREVVVLESETVSGSVTSARNSGIIHAGIYYRPGGLKARLCVEGRDKLYAYAHARGLSHRRTGKLIVATDVGQIPLLRAWQEIATQNGVTDINWLTANEAQALEPRVFCTAALHVPITGIIDVHPYLQALEADIESAGALIALRSPVQGGIVGDKGFILDVAGAAPSRISCRILINAAGLGAQGFSRNLRGLAATTIPPLLLAKGTYFSLTGASPFRMPIYPLPVAGSSGLHAFCDMAGQTRFGPDVEWVDHIDYGVDPARAALTETAVRRYWPGLPAGSLQPDYCGIRPKLGRGTPHDTDFMIQSVRDHKIDNLVCLYGIESPGLTASLAIGDYVAALVEK